MLGKPERETRPPAPSGDAAPARKQSKKKAASEDGGVALNDAANDSVAPSKSKKSKGSESLAAAESEFVPPAPIPPAVVGRIALASTSVPAASAPASAPPVSAPPISAIELEFVKEAIEKVTAEQKKKDRQPQIKWTNERTWKLFMNLVKLYKPVGNASWDNLAIAFQKAVRQWNAQFPEQAITCGALTCEGKQLKDRWDNLVKMPKPTGTSEKSQQILTCHNVELEIMEAKHVGSCGVDYNVGLPADIMEQIEQEEGGDAADTESEGEGDGARAGPSVEVEQCSHQHRLAMRRWHALV